ncbi:TPA: DNA-3-methyladenine glycosylase 2 family protein [Candidatus Poribacteria bacterium]|jgi:DNA-3-methyladenine glycosylase II|nr:DNA-3-methyladenine glycosylase 2 family protein [Candidatus Poribacteria bacterium]HIA66256.1 DNA-3-methyladenine glycosylase 2 family protein [Candidatus Poribacteria bacterium]HIB86871.1 DNA-3-methyladenine glycosylase 2 family protein [Candidatus Poribacteria bacterium]HIC00781.1 DNA-3-methyladenine glycosylase 2 family protein [Candidatus Poribacteria bacterium]HIC18862.1 DNA-3-methyladenine glycosylase 2 family protein [Candidatus Poribacteria bacterium]
MNSEFTAMDIKEGIQYLSGIDPDMKQLIDYFGVLSLNGNSNYYESLVKSIIYQQLSGKVANTIYQRFRDLYPHSSSIDPQNVYQTPLHTLRSVGLSERKATYIQGLSRKWINGEIEWDRFVCMSNEEIGLVLKTVKGIGQWTVDMFLIFSLKRPDVFPIGDLGVRKALQVLCHLDHQPTMDDMLDIAEKWRPFRSLATLYLWEIADNNISKLD